MEEVLAPNAGEPCPSQPLEEGSRDATAIRKPEFGFQLWPFRWVCVSLALPRSIPKFLHT